MNSQSNSPEISMKLPRELIQIFLLLVFSHISTLLINQPSAYWINHQYANKKLMFQQLLQWGPWVFIGISILYMLFLWLLLRQVNATWGLAIVTTLSFPHALGLFHVLYCGWKPIYETHSLGACSAYNESAFSGYFILFTLLILGSRLPVWLNTWTKRLLTTITVILVGIQVYGLFLSAFPVSSQWQPLTPDHLPGPRSGAAIAYDTQRQRAILFGGNGAWNGKEWEYDNSTWEWDGKDWKQINTPVSPSGRTLHAMAYDESRHKVVMYGGQNAGGYLADLWEYDGTTWKRLCPVCNPAARYGHKMFYDPEQKLVFVYGGQNDKIGYPEAWSWDGKVWGYFQFDTSTPGIFRAPLIHIPEENRSIAFVPEIYGGTWVWQDASWSRLVQEVKPPQRYESVLVYLPDQEYSLLFGGIWDQSILFSDTWMLNKDVWTRIETTTHPPQRFRAVAFYDPHRKSVILYGGEAFGDIYGDMWEFLPNGDATHE